MTEFISAFYDFNPWLCFFTVWAIICAIAWGLWKVGAWLSWEIFGY